MLHKQTHGSSPPLFLSLAVSFLLSDSSLVLLEELLELVDSLLELLVWVLEVLLEELLELELCFFSYSSRSCLRFWAHSEFSLAPPFLNLQIFSVMVFPWTPRPTANSGAHPLALVGGFKIWLGLSGLNWPLTSWHSDSLDKPCFLPHLILHFKSSPLPLPSKPEMKLSPSQEFSSTLTPCLKENSLLD